MFRAISRAARSSSRNASIGARYASTEPVGAVPGIPPASQSTRTPSTYMSFAMPDIYYPREPQPRAQIPYLPDFWESSPPESPQPAEPPLPKLSVVSEFDTNHSHNLHDENALPVESASVAPTPTDLGKGGILQDISEDLGISPKAIKAGVSSFFQSFR
ncbi:hypothetical protein B0H11DRAFT_2073093 [Mycena galericulata]|nr:hypothetical protein B0H11DRAFT_2073093 [Mycena galericulata]